VKVISNNTYRRTRLRRVASRQFLLVSALSTGILISAAAYAQSSASAQDVTASDGSELKEVVVTAQKRSERLVDVPISISVVSPDLLTSTDSKNLNELSGAVPGIQFNGNGGGGRTYISLRGTTGSALNTGDEPVAIYMDDVYLARGVTIGAQDLLDVGAIEIVRGPQGTLQGRNATAGAILMRSADPTPTPEGYMTATAQNPGEFRTQGAFSGPLGSGFEGRIAAGYVSSRGWGNNTFSNTYVGGDWSEQIRGILKYSGDNPLTARIVVDYASITDQPALFRNAATNFSPLPTGPVVVAPTPTVPLPSAQRSAIYDDDNYSLDPNTRTTVNTDGLSAKLAYAFPGMDLTSITGYRRTSAFGTNNSGGLATPPRLGYNHNDDTSSEVSQEMRLQSSGKERLSWILGLYYFYENQDYADDIFNLMFSTPTSTGSLYHGNQTTSSYAAFGDSTFSITDNLQVLGGVRYTRDTKHLEGGIAVTDFVTNLVTNTPYLPPTSTWSDTTYRAKVIYHPLRDLMFFGGYGTGFRAGGYNDFAVQAPFAPEKNDSYEAGAKGDLFDRKLSFSLTGYHNKYTNLQLRAGVPSGGAIITNAADSNINGFEFEITASPFANTRFAANTSYTDAKFASFPHAVDVFNHFVDATGNYLPNAPKWQYFLSAAQDFRLQNGWLLTADANYRWRDTIYFYFTNQDAATERDGPGGTFNARLSLKPNDTWTFAAFGTNLNNARIVTTDVITFSYPEVSLNQPRSYGVSVEAHF
jgi:iron complex outermembrane receptor protein